MPFVPPDQINVLWFLPTHGDSRYLGTSEGGRAVDLPYLRQVAQAADQLGYYGVLLPTGPAHREASLPRRGAPGPSVADARRPHDGDARPHL